MKRFLGKLLAFGFIVLVAFNGMAYQKSGTVPARAWLASLQSSIMSVGKKASSQFTRGESSAELANVIAVSKWTDAKGVVHYENRFVAAAQVLKINPDVNVLPPMPSADITPNAELIPKAKMVKQEFETIQEAKQAHFDALTQ